MIYLANSFSLQMLNLERVNYLEVTPINKEDVKTLLKKGFISIIGHRDTANVLSSTLNIIIPYNRISIRLNLEDTLIVAQFVGGRLPEGTNTLPEGYKIEFVKVNLVW